MVAEDDPVGSPFLPRRHRCQPLLSRPDGDVDSSVEGDQDSQRDHAAHQQHRHHRYLQF